MPLAVVALVEAHWGWSVREPGYSAGGPALPLPPPSTVAVALLAYAISARYPEVVRGKRGLEYSSRIASEALLTASAGIMKGYTVVFRDTMRYLTIPYQSPDHRKKPNLWFAAQAFGTVLAPSAELCIAAVYNRSVLDAHGIQRNDILRSAYSMTRLGSREGLVTVRHVVVVDAGRVITRGGEETVLYASRGSLRETSLTTLYTIEFWDPRAPEAYSAQGPRKRGLPKPITVEVPGDRLSSGSILLAPEEPARFNDGVKAFLAKGAPANCSIIPVL